MYPLLRRHSKVAWTKDYWESMFARTTNWLIVGMTKCDYIWETNGGDCLDSVESDSAGRGDSHKHKQHGEGSEREHWVRKRGASVIKELVKLVVITYQCVHWPHLSKLKQLGSRLGRQPKQSTNSVLKYGSDKKKCWLRRIKKDTIRMSDQISRSLTRQCSRI